MCVYIYVLKMYESIDISISLSLLGDKPLTNMLFLKRLIGRIKIEYRYFFFNSNVSRFEIKWAHGTFF